MTLAEMMAKVEKAIDNYSGDNFKNMPNKLNKREDLHIFLTIDKIYNKMPSQKNKKTGIIQASDHDIIYINHDLEEIAEVITDDEIISLVNAGAKFSEEDGIHLNI